VAIPLALGRLGKLNMKDVVNALSDTDKGLEDGRTDQLLQQTARQDVRWAEGGVFLCGF
jgi:hypothetical protein